MRLRYTGTQTLPKKITTPVPFLSLSTYQGELIFDPECDVPNEEWATYLVSLGVFEPVAVAVPPQATKPSPSRQPA